MNTQKLTVDEVREYLSDYVANNRLLDGEEFSDTFISICMSLAVDEYNMVPPFSSSTVVNFPSKSILMNGTLYKMFEGKAALYGRNTLTYSDGGLQIPVEEKCDMYRQLSSDFQNIFLGQVKPLKIHLNMESGWGTFSSDEAMFPIW
jgi:hypothetical protein